MPARQKVVASRMLKDRFVVFDNANTLNTWDAMTGQLLSSNKYNLKDYTGYQIHDFQTEHHALLKKQTKSHLIQDEDSFNEEEDDLEQEEEDEDDDEESEAEQPKEPINREDKAYRLGFNNFTLMRSKNACEDINIDDYFQAS